MQTIIDQWNNGNLIPMGTIFTVISSPKKIRNPNNNNSLQGYIVHGKTLLTTGQVVDVRINMCNCKRVDKDIVKSVDEDLIW